MSNEITSEKIPVPSKRVITLPRYSARLGDAAVGVVVEAADNLILFRSEDDILTQLLTNICASCRL